MQNTVFALEVDEKLTLRILNVSDSKKTMLVNRGIEDGLAEGDHAKFFVSVGVVARGVVVKVSPTRSIWSIYRMVNHDYIKNDQVMNLKITPPVKISMDESRMIVKEDLPAKVGSGESPEELGIPLAEGANDIDPNDKTNLRSEQQDLESLMLKENEELAAKNFEVWGILHLSALSGTSTPSQGIDEAKGDWQNLDFALGGEVYFKDFSTWYSRFSLAPYYRLQTVKAFTGFGYEATSSASELGAAVNWHPFELPNKSRAFIPFFMLSFGAGKVVDSVTTFTTTTVAETIELQGSTSTFALGAGAKYYFYKGFGLRFLADYFIRRESFEEDKNAVAWNKDLRGYRFYAGLSYRW